MGRDRVVGANGEDITHIMWILDEILDIMAPTQNTPACIPILLGIITTLCEHIPDMETARIIRKEMTGMVMGAVWMWNIQNNHTETMQ